MPHSNTVMPRPLAIRIICERLSCIWSIGRPRNPSLAPSSSTSTLTSPSSAQSSRRRPPAVVSPDTPALTTSTSSPAAVIFCCTRAGHARSGARPRPARQAVAERNDPRPCRGCLRCRGRHSGACRCGSLAGCRITLARADPQRPDHHHQESSSSHGLPVPRRRRCAPRRRPGPFRACRGAQDDRRAGGRQARARGPVAGTSSSLPPFGLGRRHFRRRVGQHAAALPPPAAPRPTCSPSHCAMRHLELQEFRNSGTHQASARSRHSGQAAVQIPDNSAIPVLLFLPHAEIPARAHRPGISTPRISS